MSHQLQNNYSVKSYLPFINQKIKVINPEKMTTEIYALIICNYDTSRFIASLSQFCQVFNNIIVHQKELKIRLSVFKNLKIMCHQAASLSIPNKGLLFIPSTISSIGIIKSPPIKRNFDKIIQRIKQNKNTTSSLHFKILQEHKTQNNMPICRAYDNPNEAVYTPKTIIDFKNFKQTLNTPQKQQNLLVQLNDVANLSDQKRGEYLESLTDMKPVSKKECKKQKWPDILIGQNAVFAKQNIPAFTVLGYYSGLYFTSQEDKLEYAKKHSTGFQTYVYSFPDVKIPSVSGFQYGNDLSCVNSGTVYAGTAYSIAQDIVKKCNIVAIYAKSLEYPDLEYVKDAKKFDLVSFVTNRDIKKGEQLLVDYGMNYWKKKTADFTKDSLEDIQVSLKNLKIKALKATHKKSNKSKLLL
ncbi:MAG: hypothetical protein ACJA1M_000132 [Alphaproteobacteria bacterium]|jgi:hypothetical protein